MSNRVEELESKVSELQAAVDGLTEELVETRARLGALEAEVEPEADEAPPVETPAGDAPTDEAAAEGVDAEKATPDEDTESASEDEDAETLDGSDIIVA